MGQVSKAGKTKPDFALQFLEKTLLLLKAYCADSPFHSSFLLGQSSLSRPSPLTPLPVWPGSLGCPEITASPQKRQGHLPLPYLASRNLDLKIITASQVLCLSCIWMELNFRWMMPTILSISLGEMGRVRLCSLRRFIT